MKTYTGYRVHAPGGGAAATVVTVHEDGRDPRPLDPRTDLRRHSVTGMEWGFSGSGPAQLALALAADALGDDDRAREVYQKLKLKTVARLPEDGWTVGEEQLLDTIRAIEDERRNRPGR